VCCQTLDFPTPITVGSGSLNIEFEGCLNDQMAGFYRSTYTNLAGEKKTMCSTQFEAIDARRCFPCWDEPAVKATFVISLTVPGHMTVFSNVNETRRQSLAGGLVKVDFGETPKAPQNHHPNLEL